MCLLAPLFQDQPMYTVLFFRYSLAQTPLFHLTIDNRLHHTLSTLRVVYVPKLKKSHASLSIRMLSCLSSCRYGQHTDMFWSIRDASRHKLTRLRD